MRYFYERPLIYSESKGIKYKCDHPLYDECTLYLDGDRGMAVIQQHIVPDKKCTFWGALDPWLVDDLYLHSGFKEIFDNIAAYPVNGLYPTVTVRQLMWSIKMKPLRKEIWETFLDKKIL